MYSEENKRIRWLLFVLECARNVHRTQEHTHTHRHNWTHFSTTTHSWVCVCATATSKVPSSIIVHHFFILDSWFKRIIIIKNEYCAFAFLPASFLFLSLHTSLSLPPASPSLSMWFFFAFNPASHATTLFHIVAHRATKSSVMNLPLIPLASCVWVNFV